MRLFVAINFDCETLDELSCAQDRLRQATESGSFSRKDMLHLTLAFLGEQPPEMVIAARGVMDEIFVPELELSFDRAGRFSRDDGDIWWAGVAPNAGLLSLQAELCTELRAAGFELQEREFVPHLTLARRVVAQSEIDSSAIITELIPARVRAISLMLSSRRDGQLCYTELYRKQHS